MIGSIAEGSRCRIGRGWQRGSARRRQQLRDEAEEGFSQGSPIRQFIRWKPCSTWRSVGPDINDGVRINIRPFLSAADLGKKGAGILRVKPSSKWDKDRGKELACSKDDFPWFWTWDGKTTDFGGGSTFDGNRWNDLHYSREFKLAARRQKGLS